MTICPLCETLIGPDEETREVWHSAPEPGPVVARATTDLDRRAVGYHEEGGRMVVLGRATDEIAAIIDALESSDRVEVETRQRVRELREAGSSEPAALVASAAAVGRTGAEVRVEPPDPPEPDAVMHEECHRSVFGGGGDG